MGLIICGFLILKSSNHQSKINQKLDRKSKRIFNKFLLGFLRVAGCTESVKSLKSNLSFKDFGHSAYNKHELKKLKKSIRKTVKIIRFCSENRTKRQSKKLIDLLIDF